MENVKNVDGNATVFLFVSHVNNSKTIFHFMYVRYVFALGMHDVIVQFTKIVRKLKSNFLKDGWGKCLFFVVWITV